MPHWGITIYEKRNHPSHQSIRQRRQSLSLCHRLSGQPSFHRATKRAFLLDQGAITKKDLTRIGSLCLMGVIGLIIASLVNMFLHNSMMDMIISYIGVLLFVGLTAYDSQKIKQLLSHDDIEVNETTQKIALMGALTLYLDFINLFIYLLRILGDRK